MNDHSLPGYDAWKLMSPDMEAEDKRRVIPTFLRGECDCCGEDKPQLWRVTYLETETFACADCCQANDDAEDDR